MQKEKSYTSLPVVYSFDLGIVLLIFLISSRVKMTKYREVTRGWGEKPTFDVPLAPTITKGYLRNVEIAGAKYPACCRV